MALSAHAAYATGADVAHGVLTQARLAVERLPG
jgi:hypothetical protein